MIQIRDVPDDLHRLLRIRAADAGLSLSAYLRRELQGIAERRSVDEVLGSLRADRADVTAAQVLDAVHEGRR